MTIKEMTMKRLITISITAMFTVLTGCAGMSQVSVRDNASLVIGPHITQNATPYTAALECLSLTAERDAAIWLAIGQIPDLTGKFSNEDGGYRITQGAQMMASTAVSKIKNVHLVERIDTSVADFERGLAGKKLLGDGQTYVLPGKGRTMNWRPITSGGVRGSDYVLTGAITEVNHNIQSGGGEAAYYNVGVKARKYALNVAADLRLVNTRTLEVVASTTLQKQIIGYEFKAGLFRFFGTEVVDLNGGMKNNEPIQLGVRAILEAGVIQLLAEVMGGDASGCITGVEKAFDADPARVMTSPSEVASELADDLTPPAPVEAPIVTERFGDPARVLEVRESKLKRSFGSKLRTPINTKVATELNKMGE